MTDKKKVLITILVVIVLVLVAVVVYLLVIQPAISGYTIQKQTEGVQIAVNSILAQLQQNGFVQIPVGNQTLYLAPFNPQQVQQQSQATQETVVQ
jgi:uncharacterized protein (UPF0212 family)